MTNERIYGVVIGIVSNIDDPNGEGRVQVRFPWLPNEPVSAWAPVSAPLAGPSRGMYLSPEIDDDVLIAFEHGNFDKPFILGYLWNGVDTPPETDRENRVLVTPGGHSLRFEDGDSKKVIVRSSSGHQVTLDDASGAAKISIVSAGSQSITIDDSAQKVEIKGGGRTISLQGGQVQFT